MALILFWLHLVFLVSPCFSWFSCSTCSSVPHVVSEALGSWRWAAQSLAGSPEFSSAIGSPEWRSVRYCSEDRNSQGVMLPSCWWKVGRLGCSVYSCCRF